MHTHCFEIWVILGKYPEIKITKQCMGMKIYTENCVHLPRATDGNVPSLDSNFVNVLNREVQCNIVEFRR